MWASQGRSPQTRARAADQSLVDASTIENLCRSCSIIISVCPPHAAGEVAEKVMACSFKGLFVDVNAISPQRTQQISEKMQRCKARGYPLWMAELSAVQPGNLIQPGYTSQVMRHHGLRIVSKVVSYEQKSSAHKSVTPLPSRCVTPRSPKAPARSCARLWVLRKDWVCGNTFSASGIGMKWDRLNATTCGCAV